MTEGAANQPPTDRSTDRVESVPTISAGQVQIPPSSGPETPGAQPAPEGIRVLAGQCSQSSEGGRAFTSVPLSRIAQSLSDRDWSVLHLVNEHRFLTRTHLTALLFADHATTASGERTCRRVLARLTALRIVEPLQRRIGGVRAGSASLVFQTGLRGDMLLRQRRGQSGRARRKEPSLRHLDHSLAIADIRVVVAQAAAAKRFDLVTVETEPYSWRDYNSPGGARLTLKPDIHVVTASGDFEDLWFLEADRSTESLPVVLRQCQLYQDYRASRPVDEAFPRVVWVVPDEHRVRKVTEAIRSARKLDGGLFRVTTLDNLIALIAEGAA